MAKFYLHGMYGDIASFSKGLKKAGRAFKKGGDRVGASQRKKKGGRCKEQKAWRCS